MSDIVIENGAIFMSDGIFYADTIALHDGKITDRLSGYALKIFVLAGNMAG